jgi:hypothetical protein
MRRRRTNWGHAPRRRSLRFEPLEDRRLLAAFTVSNLNDAGAGSLRQAIAGANGAAGADTIEFAPALAGTIVLTSGEIVITQALAINGPGQSVVTVNAQQQSRIFNITAITGDFTIGGLTLTGGRTTGNNANLSDTAFSGGAIRALTTGRLDIEESTISGSGTTGRFATGGAIFSRGTVNLTQSFVSGNNTAGYFAPGGGVRANGSVTLTQSTVSGNGTTGSYSTAGGVYSGGAVTMTHSTVSGNNSATSGGGIRAAGNVSATSSTLHGNSTTSGRGGGVYADGSVSLSQSTVSGNITDGSMSRGGGIYAKGNVTLIQSTVSGNSTKGSGGDGGGIATYDGTVSLNQSTVSGNSTTANAASGGGVYARSVTLIRSTVDRNSTAGAFSYGGGIDARGAVTITQSTISGNSTSGSSSDGGGMSVKGAVSLNQSTVTRNHAMHASSTGGGVFQDAIFTPAFLIGGSIIADNTAVGGGANLVKNSGSTLTINYSLIDAGITPDAGDNNVLTDDPQLGPLADNGGPTLTHALLPDSPAIDTGDPAAVAGVGGVAAHDQRGAPFTRVYGGRIDIGAVEKLPVGFLPGDYNNNGVVDTGDYTVWRDTLSSTTDTRADGNGDAVVDALDYAVWQSNFGATSADIALPPGSGGSQLTAAAGGGALAASQRLAGEGGDEVLSALAVREESTRNAGSRRAVRSRLFAHALAEESGRDLLIAALARRAKCAERVGETKLDREENESSAVVDEVFARVGGRGWRLG